MFIIIRCVSLKFHGVEFGLFFFFTCIIGFLFSSYWILKGFWFSSVEFCNSCVKRSRVHSCLFPVFSVLVFPFLFWWFFPPLCPLHCDDLHVSESSPRAFDRILQRKSLFPDLFLDFDLNATWFILFFRLTSSACMSECLSVSVIVVHFLRYPSLFLNKYIWVIFNHFVAKMWHLTAT